MDSYGRVWPMLASDQVGGERKEGGYELEGTRVSGDRKGEDRGDGYVG